jgi:XRE family transcriptional regulator, fatty acid utilization regulator
MAEGLGISPSYINLIERNQRPATAQILLRLAETYDLDLRDLATADEDRFFAELNEIFSDPLFRQIDVPKQELRDLAELCPGVTHSLQRLYAAYTEARRGETLVAAQMADRNEGARFEANPIERVRDLIEANRNYFPELEQAAETLRDELGVPPVRPAPPAASGLRAGRWYRPHLPARAADRACRMRARHRCDRLPRRPAR